MAQLQFDARTVKPMEAFEPLPEGGYHVKITDSVIKPTANGLGEMLALTLEVLDGQYAGRKVFDNINRQNANPTAVKIGDQRLSAYCYAVGVIPLTDTNQLHGIPFSVRLTIRKQDGYDPSNSVKEIKPLGVASAKAMAPASAATPAWAQPPAPAPSAPPPQAPPALPPPVPVAPKLGDVVNGYMLTPTGWVLQAPPAPPAPPAPGPQFPWSKQ